jgi:hypothetical protein
MGLEPSSAHTSSVKKIQMVVSADGAMEMPGRSRLRRAATAALISRLAPLLCCRCTPSMFHSLPALATPSRPSARQRVSAPLSRLDRRSNSRLPTLLGKEWRGAGKGSMDSGIAAGVSSTLYMCTYC